MAAELKRALIHEDDLEPLVRGKPRKLYRVRWSRKALGRFITRQMLAKGYYVKKSVITLRQGPGHYNKETSLRLSPGTVIKGFWADHLLAAAAEISADTVQRLRDGLHVRSPFFFTVLKVFRALGLEIVLTPSEDTDVAFLAKGW